MSLNQDTKRLFIAIRCFPDPFFEVILKDLKMTMKDEKIRWVKKENLHITLRFIGDCEAEKIPGLSEMLSKVAVKEQDFSLKFTGIGVFRSISYPKVIWAGIEPSEELQRIKNRVDEGLNRLGFSFEEGKYNPHLTLGRLKYLKNKVVLKETIEAYNSKVLLRQDVESIVLMESRLRQKGPEYYVLGEYFFPENEL